MKVAYFSPLPPSTSGIADYSALLLPALERLVEVEVVRPGRTRPVAGADVALYHIGNDPDAHAWIVDALRRQSGVVVLHDFVVHHLMAGMTIGRNDGHAYLAAMERDAGAAGRMLGWGVLEGRVPPLWEVRPTEFPLVGEVLDRATGVIVHSHYVEAQVREHGYDGPLWVIPHPAWPTADVEPASVTGAPLLGSFGHLNENKRVPQLLRAFAELGETHPDARLLLVGAEAGGFTLRAELPEGVVREPYVEEERLMAYMAACDAVVLLRSPTMGETSGSAIRALSLGKPLVVSDLGWFAELPDAVALKAPVGEGEEEALVEAFERLAEPAVAAGMGAAAREYVRSEHDVDHVAGLYAAALEQAAGAAAVETRVLRDVAAAAAETGLPPEALAPDLAELGIARGGRAAQPARRAWPLPAWPMWLWVGALYAVAVAVLLTLALRVKSPWIMVDELVYSDTARSVADGAGFTIHGVSAGYGYVYPALLAIPYAAVDRVADVYQLARVLNALLMCSVVLPTYLLARRVVRPPAALAVAALAVALPPMVYVASLMTENVFYPLFMWVAYALVLALERPTLRRQVVVLALCLLAFLTRAQAIVLVVTVLTAPLALAWIERGRPRSLRAWKPLYALVVLAGILVVVWEVARGRSVFAALGGYSVTGSTSYSFWPALKWIVLHLSGLDLALWVIPAAATIVVVASARHLDRPLRVFAAATVSLTVWLVLEVAVFASHFSNRIEERNLFYLAPLFLIALFAWIERGQPRPPRATVAAAVVCVALAGAIPFADLLNENSQSDTPFLQPWWYLGQSWTGKATVSVVASVTALALAAAFLWLPARFAGWLPALVAAGFVATWLPLEAWPEGFPQASVHFYDAAVAAGTSWVDQAVGTDANVAVLWSGGAAIRAWENEFWNRSIRRVYALEPLPGGMQQVPVTTKRASGVIVAPDGKPIDADYVLTDSRTPVVGSTVASDTAHQLVLIRAQRPVRLAQEIEGWYPDSWTGPTLTWTRYGCTGGRLRFDLRSDATLYAGVTQHVAVSGTTPARTILLPSTLQSGLTKTVPLHPVRGRCRVVLRITPARIPASFPRLHRDDTRQLGVHVDFFRYLPTR
ncbi:MAG TPA: glycosyltransferase [Gaiellaceae bacterium]|nr:glycosyltransferase [Gaiellaceae bacterium]